MTKLFSKSNLVVKFSYIIVKVSDKNQNGY